MSRPRPPVHGSGPADTVGEVGEFGVIARVQSVDGITRTLTCPVVNI